MKKSLLWATLAMLLCTACVTNRTAALVKRGNSFLLKDNYDRAIAKYNEAITLDPTYAFAYFYFNNKELYDNKSAGGYYYKYSIKNIYSVDTGHDFALL
jgi:tetratricopeptide (TPR) repeat protein